MFQRLFRFLALFSLSPKNIFPINSVLFPQSIVEPVKKVRVESKIDVKVLVMVVMKIGMRLPWPDGAHFDSGMVAQSVVVGIEQHKQEGEGVDWDKKRCGCKIALIHDKFQRMHCHCAPGRGLVVPVVHFVDLFIQPGVVEQTVEVVSHRFVIDKERD